MPAFVRSLRLALVACLVAVPWVARAIDYQVSIDTTPLSGQAGYVAFDLVGGTPGVVNTVVLSDFVSSSELGAGSASGDVIGALPMEVTLASTGFFNEYLQAVTFAEGLTSFSLSISGQHTPGDIPDQFALFLLDQTSAPFATSDPTNASALIVIDLVQVPQPQLYASVWATVTLVPEPAASALLAVGLAGLVVLRALRRS